ncbi:MAG: transposase [Tannerellaceae bacterium]|nr:transposase [Tannerellaceae bacterium]
MSQSLSLLYVHLIFHIGNKSTALRSVEANPLFHYISGILKEKECYPVRVNGMPDHVHLLFVLSKNIALADLVRDVKRSSTNWLKTTNPYYRNFRWQTGYGAFSVSVSSYQRVINYIDNQPQHHAKKSFREEYLYLLKESGIEYNEEFLWND